MQNGIAGIDHVIVGVRALEGARARWMRLGFTPTPRGRHLGQGTANYCVMFAADYIELLCLADPADTGQPLASFLARREGPMAAAFALAATPKAARALPPPLAAAPSRPPPRTARRDGRAALQPDLAAARGDARSGLLPVRPSDAAAAAAAGMARPCQRRPRRQGHRRAGRQHGAADLRL